MALCMYVYYICVYMCKGLSLKLGVFFSGSHPTYQGRISVEPSIPCFELVWESLILASSLLGL